MKIGFDAKRAAQNRTGLGNYSRFIIRILSELRPDNEYHLYTPKPHRIPYLEGNTHIKPTFPSFSIQGYMERTKFPLENLGYQQGYTEKWY